MSDTETAGVDFSSLSRILKSIKPVVGSHPGEDMKYIDIEKFVDEGYLQEVNRQFFHPLGLALTVTAETDDETGEPVGPWSLAGIRDVRDDPEGMIFTEVDTEKVRKVEEAASARKGPRTKGLGYWVQPPE